MPCFNFVTHNNICIFRGINCQSWWNHWILIWGKGKHHCHRTPVHDVLGFGNRTDHGFSPGFSLLLCGIGKWLSVPQSWVYHFLNGDKKYLSPEVAVRVKLNPCRTYCLVRGKHWIPITIITIYKCSTLHFLHFIL